MNRIRARKFAYPGSSDDDEVPESVTESLNESMRMTSIAISDQRSAGPPASSNR